MCDCFDFYYPCEPCAFLGAQEWQLREPDLGLEKKTSNVPIILVLVSFCLILYHVIFFYSSLMIVLI